MLLGNHSTFTQKAIFCYNLRDNVNVSYISRDEKIGMTEQTHPLKEYLKETRESVPSFAGRIGVSRQTLYRIIKGDQIPKPSLARRIVEAAGGSIIFADLYAYSVAPNAQTAESIIDIEISRSQKLELNVDILAQCLEMIVLCLKTKNDLSLSPGILKLAAEAIANTHSALARVTTRHGQARLAQALRPVLEEILKEHSATLPPVHHLEEAASCAASLYYRCLQLQTSVTGQ